MTVEKLVSKLFHYRESTLNMFCKYFLQFKEKLLANKIKADSMANTEDKFAALFDSSLHIATSEAYFLHSTYDISKNLAKMTLNVDGKAMDSLDYKNRVHRQWVCEELLCKIDKDSVLNR